MCAKQALNLWRYRYWCVSRFALLLAAALICSVSVAIGQDTKTDDKPPPIPPPEEVPADQLTTPDGVKLAATYFPSNQGKDAVPVILLHMHRGSQPGTLGSGKDFGGLATRLQALGHAVLVPDLRGHGGSKERRGSAVLLDAAKMSAKEYTNMVLMDMPTLKTFLVEENNAGRLNIEKLVVVGAEMGASVALYWAYFDWSIPPVGYRKQGQDVKALVLISPERSTPGLPIAKMAKAAPLVTRVYDSQLKKAFRNPNSVDFNTPVALDFRREVSALIFVGKRNPKALKDAERVLDIFKKAKRSRLDADAQKDLFYDEYATRLQGTRLLNKRFPIEKYIELFIDLRAAKRPFRWAKRENPYSKI